MPSLVSQERQAELAEESRTGFTEAVFETQRIAERLDAALRTRVLHMTREEQEVRDVIARLFAENDEGKALGEVARTARQLQEKGQRLEKDRDDAAVRIHCHLGGLLLARGNVGWAVDEYYRATAVLLARARLEEAAELLREIRDMIQDRDRPQSDRLTRHIAILQVPETPAERLNRLCADIDRDNHDLAESCLAGLRRVKGGP